MMIPAVIFPAVIFPAVLHSILWHLAVLHHPLWHPNRNIAAIAHDRDFNMAAHMPACQPGQRHSKDNDDQSRAQIGIYRGQHICPKPV